jgi:geranylgeranyl diphosphate synthase type I
MIYLKTGALIEASAIMGALAAEASPSTIKRIGDYGKFVGIAFQIRDDILGVFGDPAKTGKPVYNDIKRGKKTLLLLYAYKQASDNDRSLLEKALKGLVRDDDEAAEVARIIERTGSLSYALETARTLVNTAVSILDELPVEDLEAKEILRQLALFSIEREK